MKAHSKSRGIDILFFNHGTKWEWEFNTTPQLIYPRNAWYRRLGGPQGQYSQVWKSSSPLGLDPQTVQPVVRHYTDYTISAHRPWY
jgi:hypothetical protein